MPDTLQNSKSLSPSRHDVNLVTYKLFMMHILVTVSAVLFVVAFESSEWKWPSVVDPSVATVHVFEGPNESADVEDPMEKRDGNLKHQVQSDSLKVITNEAVKVSM